MDKKVLEILNQFLTVGVYSFILFKSLKSECFNFTDNIITLNTIIVSILIMLYSWSIK